MSQYPHDHYRAPVTVDPTASSPAPVDEGKKKGYFDDSATRVLLELSPSDALLHSGTYGTSELSVQPIKLSTLRTLSYDRRLLPFTPANHPFTGTYIAMHDRNRQHPVLAQTRKNLEENLNRALLDAQIAANSAGISLPNYAISLVPRLKYSEGGDDRPFPHQFKIFFVPSASRTRGVRIGRVGATLDATTNAASAMAGNPKGWPKGEPVGISIDTDEILEEDSLILAAYQALEVPRKGQLPNGVEIVTLTREEARDVLIGKTLGKSIPITNIPDVAPGFDPDTGLDDDALFYVAIAPDHDDHNLNADGEATTRGQRREEADHAFMNDLHAQRDEEARMEQDPVPPYEPVQTTNENTFTTSMLQTSLVESANVGQTQSLTPASATVSIPSSEAVSATSSNPDITAPRARRSTVAAQRSRNYHGPYTQPISSSSRARPFPPRRAPSPVRRYSPSPPRRYSPPRHTSSRRYSPPGRSYSRRSPSPNRMPTRRHSPSPPNAALNTLRGRNMPNVPGVRIIQTQELHRIVQDTDTGISALVPIMQVSSSQMGLDLSALMQPANPEGRPGRQGIARNTPRSIEGFRDSPNEYYHPRPRSPPRRSSRRQSPSPNPPRRFSPPRRRSPSPPQPHLLSRCSSPPPRRSNHGSNQRHPQQVTRRFSPPRHEPPRPHNNRSTSSHAQENEPMEIDPSHTWGESSVDLIPSQPWGSLELSTDGKTTAGPSGTSRNSDE